MMLQNEKFADLVGPILTGLSLGAVAAGVAVLAGELMLLVPKPEWELPGGFTDVTSVLIYLAFLAVGQSQIDLPEEGERRKKASLVIILMIMVLMATWVTLPQPQTPPGGGGFAAATDNDDDRELARFLWCVVVCWFGITISWRILHRPPIAGRHLWAALAGSLGAATLLATLWVSMVKPFL